MAQSVRPGPRRARRGAPNLAVGGRVAGFAVAPGCGSVRCSRATRT